jgi:hypothetical protein
MRPMGNTLKFLPIILPYFTHNFDKFKINLYIFVKFHNIIVKFYNLEQTIEKTVFKFSKNTCIKLKQSD